METVETQVEPCKSCNGSGTKKEMIVLRDEVCRECEGTGQKVVTRKLLCD